MVMMVTMVTMIMVLMMNVLIIVIVMIVLQVNRESGATLSPLFAASCEGHASCVKLLIDIEHTDINDGDHIGRSPLYAACFNGIITLITIISKDIRLS